MYKRHWQGSDWPQPPSTLLRHQCPRRLIWAYGAGPHQPNSRMARSVRSPRFSRIQARARATRLSNSASAGGPQSLGRERPTSCADVALSRGRGDALQRPPPSLPLRGDVANQVSVTRSACSPREPWPAKQPSECPAKWVRRSSATPRNCEPNFMVSNCSRRRPHHAKSGRRPAFTAKAVIGR